MPVGAVDYRRQGSPGPTAGGVATVIARAFAGGGGGIERRDLGAEAEMRRIKAKTDQANRDMLKKRYPNSPKMFEGQ